MDDQLTTIDNNSGAGGSEGRTSWTAKPELQDYVSFYGFMLQYLRRLKHALADKQQGLSPERSPPSGGDDGIRLILGGYSFGSLITSHAPGLDVILDLFRSNTASPSQSVDQIGSVAREIASASLRRLGPENPDLGTADDSRPRAPPSISICYLLVSPLLPPVSQFLTAFSNLSLNVGVEGSAQAQHGDQLSTHSTLALYGDQDTFTSARKLQRWSAEMARVPQSRFQSCEVAGAGHFWREDGVEARARQRLREWLQQL
ncbi:hypothetical protein N7532_009315 [Penicillium argentinense]|uniref:Uncharacterized protein n=1 Tax=Penicillium argentinense TaxID=1131581 RepID=A0A9W9K2V2_9EURO|nr:uncharacterized protein N7532_009315 [Penicillium argentinense]KAJ5090631.1 hypothetical protein N7532_009315 [Penicillium argentinense]